MSQLTFDETAIDPEEMENTSPELSDCLPTELFG
jgi:hypothetical protein